MRNVNDQMYCQYCGEETNLFEHSCDDCEERLSKSKPCERCGDLTEENEICADCSEEGLLTNSEMDLKEINSMHDIN